MAISYICPGVGLGSLADAMATADVSWRGKRVALSSEWAESPPQDKGQPEGCLLYVLSMEDGENRLSPAMNEELHRALDLVLADVQGRAGEQRVALLVTGQAKYFSLGLDLASYMADPQPQQCFHTSYQRLLARLLRLPMLTVAAINGHAIAGGMVLALACDFRVMDGRRGLLAMNEIHLPSSIPCGMLSLVQAKVGDPRLQRDILTLGRRFTSAQAHQRGLVDDLVGEGTVLEAARRVAGQHAHPVRKAPFLEIIKELQYRHVLRDLTEPEAFDHFLFAASKQ